MFKLLTLGILFYLLYTFVIKRPQIEGKQDDPAINDQQDDEGEYVDYEEVD